MRAGEFYTKILGMVEENTRKTGEIGEQLIRQGATLDEFVRRVTESEATVKVLKEEFAKHKDDSVTWAKLGKIFAGVASVVTFVACVLGILKALGKI